MDAPLVSPRAARTFYNLADALAPGGEADLVPGLERRLRWQGVGAARRVWLLLLLLEWWPRLTLRSARGFSWLPLERRSALLAAWRESRIAPLRRAASTLETLVRESGGACRSHSDSGA